MENVSNDYINGAFLKASFFFHKRENGENFFPFQNDIEIGRLLKANSDSRLVVSFFALKMTLDPVRSLQIKYTHCIVH